MTQQTFRKNNIFVFFVYVKHKNERKFVEVAEWNLMLTFPNRSNHVSQALTNQDFSCFPVQQSPQGYIAYFSRSQTPNLASNP